MPNAPRKVLLLIAAIGICLYGCTFNAGPKDDKEFYKIQHLPELSGTYKNKGDPSGYLSGIIWGNTSGLRLVAKDIEFIDVAATDTSVTVRAIAHGCAIYEQTYVAGRDFKITDGQIVLSRKMALLNQGAGDVLVGPRYETVTLGLDANKQGKYRNSGYAAGLVFLLFPVAMSGHDDVRFERVENDGKGFAACDGSPRRAQ